MKITQALVSTALRAPPPPPPPLAAAAAAAAHHRHSTAAGTLTVSGGGGGFRARRWAKVSLEEKTRGAFLRRAQCPLFPFRQVYFGQNIITDPAGTVRVGDLVTVTSKQHWVSWGT